MDANAQHELYLIKNELQGIIDELYSIAGGVSRDFEGIGNSQCANSILKAAAQYETVKQKLNTMNLSVVTEEFATKKCTLGEVERFCNFGKWDAPNYDACCTFWLEFL